MRVFVLGVVITIALRYAPRGLIPEVVRREAEPTPGHSLHFVQIWTISNSGTGGQADAPRPEGICRCSHGTLRCLLPSGSTSPASRPANRKRLSAPALRTFLAIADLWGLSEEAAPPGARLSVALDLSQLGPAGARARRDHPRRRCADPHLGGARHPPGAGRPVRDGARRPRLAARPASGAGVRRPAAAGAGHQRLAGRPAHRAAFPRRGARRALHGAERRRCRRSSPTAKPIS